MLINYFLMAFNMVMPYAVIHSYHRKVEHSEAKERKINIIVLFLLTVFLLFTFVWEICFVLHLHLSTGTKCNCLFILVKLLSGALRRGMGILQAYVSTILIETGDS